MFHTETYQNQTYRFSFVYPAEYDIRQNMPEWAMLGNESGAIMNGIIDVVVYDEYIDGTETSYDAFVRYRLLNSCAADGPTGSISCTDISSSGAIITGTNLHGRKLYLTEVTENFETDETVTNERGPYYIFDLGGEIGSKHVLVIQPAGNLPAGQVDEDLLADIVDTLRIEGASSATRDTAGEGEMCGGIAGILCEEGLTCDYEGTYPDAAGTCI